MTSLAVPGDSTLHSLVLFELIDSPSSEPIDPDVAPPLVLAPAARIELRDVHFSYRPGEPVIRGMSLVAEPGNGVKHRADQQNADVAAEYEHGELPGN